MDIDEQTALVDKLMACYSAGKRLFYELEDQGHPAAADVKKLNADLGERIEDLLKNLYGAWAGDAGRLRAQISRANRSFSTQGSPPRKVEEIDI